jgi:hypothetical protein
MLAQGGHGRGHDDEVGAGLRLGDLAGAHGQRGWQGQPGKVAGVFTRGRHGVGLGGVARPERDLVAGRPR